MMARLRVDFIACKGRGLCAEALPELISLDDWGFPIASSRPVPPWLLPDVRATLRACPLLALRLEAAVSSAVDHGTMNELRSADGRHGGVTPDRLSPMIRC
jgi:ferredoxin